MRLSSWVNLIRSENIPKNFNGFDELINLEYISILDTVWDNTISINNDLDVITLSKNLKKVKNITLYFSPSSCKYNDAYVKLNFLNIKFNYRSTLMN